MNKVVALRNNVRIVEEVLADSSSVFDVTVGNVSFHMPGYKEAFELLKTLSVVAKTVHEEG